MSQLAQDVPSQSRRADRSRVLRFWAALLLFVPLGVAQCRLRDTSGYCQCEKTCPFEGGGEGCVATNDPRYGCASKLTCEPCGYEHATATCDNDGRCALGGCEANFADCDGIEANGCETDYTKSAEHCGGCYRPCPSSDTHAESRCENGLCLIDYCLDGYADCNNWYPDGCEAGPDVGCDAGTAGNAGSVGTR